MWCARRAPSGPSFKSGSRSVGTPRTDIARSIPRDSEDVCGPREETKEKRNALPLFRLQPSILFRPSRMLGQDLERHLLHPRKVLLRVHELESVVDASSPKHLPRPRVTPEEHRGIRPLEVRMKYTPSNSRANPRSGPISAAFQNGG